MLSAVRAGAAPVPHAAHWLAASAAAGAVAALPPLLGAWSDRVAVLGCALLVALLAGYSALWSP